jgi:sugar phosphate isomerase/epimerase
MQLGIGSHTFTWAVGVANHPPPRPMTAEDLLDRAVELGVSVVQYCDNLPLDRLSTEARCQLARRARDLNIKIEVGTRGIAAEHLRRYLASAQQFASPIVRLVIDTAQHHPDPDEIVARLRGLLPEFEAAGVVLAIENHDRFRAATLATILERVDSSHIGICLDTVNSFGALEGPDVVLDALGPWVVNLHVKEFVVRRASHNMGFVVEGLPAGQGMLDLPWLLGRLRQLGRDPDAILEQWTPPEPDLAATIAKEAAWAVESIAYLRRLIPLAA